MITVHRWAHSTLHGGRDEGLRILLLGRETGVENGCRRVDVGGKGRGRAQRPLDAHGVSSLHLRLSYSGQRDPPTAEDLREWGRPSDDREEWSAPSQWAPVPLSKP